MSADFTLSGCNAVLSALSLPKHVFVKSAVPLLEYEDRLLGMTVAGPIETAIAVGKNTCPP
jgi:hypothetical protein